MSDMSMCLWLKHMSDVTASFIRFDKDGWQPEAESSRQEAPIRKSTLRGIQTRSSERQVKRDKRSDAKASNNPMLTHFYNLEKSVGICVLFCFVHHDSTHSLFV